MNPNSEPPKTFEVQTVAVDNNQFRLRKSICEGDYGEYTFEVFEVPPYNFEMHVSKDDKLLRVEIFTWDILCQGWVSAIVKERLGVNT
jgi:hypothetical protein